MAPTITKTHEHELAELRAQVAELQETMAVLAASVNSLTKSVEGLVSAWNTAKGVTAFVKWLGGLLVSGGIIWSLIYSGRIPHG